MATITRSLARSSTTPPPPLELPWKQHPSLKLWPISDRHVDQLMASIQRKGWNTARPIEIWRDQIVDGRVRLEALRRLEIQPEWGVHLVELDEDLSEEHIWERASERHGTRRDLNKSQLAAVAVGYLPHYEAAARLRMLAGTSIDEPQTHPLEGYTTLPMPALEGGSNPPTHPSQGAQHKGEAAKLLAAEWGIGATLIRLAKRLAKNAPDLLELVRQGKLTINAANKRYEIDNGLRAEKEPRINLRFDPSDKPLIDLVRTELKKRGISLGARILELLRRDKTLFDQGIWEQAEAQLLAFGVATPKVPLHQVNNPPTDTQMGVTSGTLSVVVSPDTGTNDQAPDKEQVPEATPDNAPDASSHAHARVSTSLTNPLSQLESEFGERTKRQPGEESDEGSAPNHQPTQTKPQAPSLEVKLTAPIQQIVETYNTVATAWNEAHKDQSIALTLNKRPGPKLERELRHAWAEAPDLEQWKDAFEVLHQLAPEVIKRVGLRSLSRIVRPPKSQPGTERFLWRLPEYIPWQPTTRAPVSHRAAQVSPPLQPSSVALPAPNEGRPSPTPRARSTRYNLHPSSQPRLSDSDLQGTLPATTHAEFEATLVAPDLVIAGLPPLPNVATLTPDDLDHLGDDVVNRLSQHLAELHGERLVEDIDAEIDAAWFAWKQGFESVQGRRAPPLNSFTRIALTAALRRAPSLAALEAALTFAGQCGVEIGATVKRRVHLWVWIQASNTSA